MPAQVTTVSIGPRPSSVAFTSALTAAASDTSAWTASARRPSPTISFSSVPAALVSEA